VSFACAIAAPAYDRPMNWQQLCKLGLELPEVAEGIWFRTPALTVRGKSFVRLKEDGKSVVFLSENVDEQEMLIETQPELYYITDHYRGWPAVLARLSKLRAGECRLRLERAWCKKAPKTLVKAFEGAPPKRRR
jgi:hypothetical protein